MEGLRGGIEGSRDGGIMEGWPVVLYRGIMIVDGEGMRRSPERMEGSLRMMRVSTGGRHFTSMTAHTVHMYT